MRQVIKWGLVAVGAYLVYRWWQGDGEEVAGGTLPADEGMWSDEGGGGGGGSAGGGDYQQEPTPDPAGTSPLWSPRAKRADASKLFAAAGTAIASTPPTSNVKPGWGLPRRPRLSTRPRVPRPTPIPRRPPR